MRKILFFLLFSTLFAGEGVLFYFQDAGELYGLLPVAKKLRSQGIAVQILGAGTAESLLAKSGEEFLSLHLPVNPVDRSQVFLTEEVEKAIDSLDPAVFVSGVAFALEGQLFEAFTRRGVETVAFWDNFNADGADPYFKTAHAVERLSSRLWVSSKTLAESDWFCKRENLFISGHPSLEKWVKDAVSVDVKSLRQQLHLNPNRKVAVFIGGYGSQYEEAFELFLCSIENLEIDFLIQPHPKYGGSVEEGVLARTGLNCEARILKNEVSTLEAIALSDIVLCHQSSVGFQALFLQKPVIHILPVGQEFTSLPLELGLSQKAKDRETLKNAFRWAETKQMIDFYQVLGLPKESVDRSVDALLELLETSASKTHKE